MPSPLTGQVTTTGGQADPGHTADSCKAFTLKTPVGNSQRVYIGAAGVTSGTGYPMDPGDEITYERIAQSGQPTYELRPSDFYAALTTGDVLGWLASP